MDSRSTAGERRAPAPRRCIYRTHGIVSLTARSPRWCSIDSSSATGLQRTLRIVNLVNGRYRAHALRGARCARPQAGSSHRSS
jgi:hypothetical protein